MSYPHQHQIHKAMLNQDLIVAHELFMTPTAMMADYVLPGDAFSERNHIVDSWSWTTRLGLSQKVAEPPEQASNSYQFWRDLAVRFDFEEWCSWSTYDEVLDYRLSRSGRSFSDFEAQGFMKTRPLRYRKYRKTGFATPSGKVEPSSSVLGDLGFDPLPCFRPGPATSEEFPTWYSTVCEDPFFLTGQRNIKELRGRCPVPRIFMHPDDSKREGLTDGEWIELRTAYGAVSAELSVQPNMETGHLRVPHGWWYPEATDTETLAGAFLSSDAVLCSDDDELLDHEQGVPRFKGFPGRGVKAAKPDAIGAA